MSKKLPFVTSQIPRDLRAFLDRVRDLVSSGGRDRLLTLGDLVDSGVVDDNGRPVIPGSDLSTPPAPANVQASAAIRNIIVTWDDPAYRGHAYAEVWVSSTDDLSAAVLLGMTPGAIYIHGVGPSSTRYYWVRFVNTNDVKGPYSAISGTSATTGSDTAYTLGVLANSVTSSELSTTLNSRIDLIDGPDSVDGSVNARLKAETDSRIQALSAETDARALADGILTSALSSETGARADADSITTSALRVTQQSTAQLNNSLATAENLRASVDALLAAADNVNAQGLSATRAAVISEVSSRTTADAALAASITAVVATAANNSAAIITEQVARASADDALALQISLVSAGVGEQFDYADIWYFDSGVDDWTGNGTPTTVDGWLRPANQTTTPYVVSPEDLDIDAVKWTQARLRVRKYGTPTWDGYLWWKSPSDTTWNTARRVALDEPTYDSNGIGLISVTIAWQSAGTVDSIRIDLSTAQDDTDYFIIDWVAVGRPAPGASTAALIEEQQARAAADIAEATARTTLTAALVGSGYAPGDTLAELTSGLIYDERVARATETGALVSSVNSLVATVAGKNGVYRQNTPPLNPSTNDIWVDTSVSYADQEYFDGTYGAAKHKQYQWDGVSWLDITDNDIFDTQAAITVERLARVSETESLAQQITTLSATQTFTSAALIVEQTARATADSATAAQITSLAATTKDSAAALVVEQTVRTTADAATVAQVSRLTATTGDNAAAVVGEQMARTTADSATAAQIARLAATTGDNAAAVTTEQTARTTADSATAAQVQVLSAAVGQSDAAIKTEQSARATADSAVASQTTSLLSRTADNAALLFAEQTARTTADAATASQIVGISAQTGNAFSAVQSEAVARATQDSALAQSITTLSAEVNDPTTGLPATRATLINDYLTKVDTENAIAQSSSFLRAYAAIQSKVFRQADTPTKRGVDPETAANIPLEAGDVWYDTNDLNKLYQWDGAQWVYSPDQAITGAISTVDARVTTVETAKIGYCTINGLASDDTNRADCEAAGGVWNQGIPIATAVKQVAVTDANGSTAAIEQAFTAQKTLNDQFKLQYTVKLDVNGNVTGYGLYNTGTSSSFIINSDRFAVTTPQSSIPLRVNNTPYSVGQIVRLSGVDDKTLVCKAAGTSGASTPTPGALGSVLVDGSVRWQVASRVPFAVQAVPQTINGVTVPAGVYVDAAYILNATIQNAQIADLAVDDTKIADLSVGKLTAGSIKVGDFIQSTNYIAGTQGWRIHGNGFAEFGAASIRGQLTAAQIDSRGLSIRDLSGNIILAAGTPLSAANVSGLGALAAKNTVSASTDVTGLGALATKNTVSASTDVTGLGSLATQNAVNWNTQITNIPAFGNFAYLSTITSANISTYIEGAAIGTAYISDLNATKITAGTIAADRLDSTIITAKVANLAGAQIGDAEIGTLKIAGNAVTIPLSAYTSGSIALTKGVYTTVQSVNYSVSESVSFAITCTVIPNGSWSIFKIRIMRGATVVFESSEFEIVSPNAFGCQPISVSIIDTAPTGSGTYYFDIAPRGGTGGSVSSTYSHRILTALGVKR